MFLIPTYLGRSEIHGTGVFTPHFIPEGTVIWDFTPGVDWKLRPEEIEAFPEPYQAQLRRWCYLNDQGVYVLCGDAAKFMNHSYEPNCDDSGERTVAARDIEPGEELTCDYRTFDRTSRENGQPVFEEAVAAD